MTQIQHTFICCSHRTVQGICSMLGSEQGCFCSMLSLRNWTSIVSAVLSVTQGHTLLTLCCREHNHMPTPNRVRDGNIIFLCVLGCVWIVFAMQVIFIFIFSYLFSLSYIPLYGGYLSRQWI